MIPARRFIVYILLILTLNSCSKMKGFIDLIQGLQNIEFQLDGISDVDLSGINIKSDFKLTDLSTVQVIQLTRNAASQKLPLSFTLFVEAKNPNPREGRKSSVDAKITDFPFQLILNNKLAFSGNIGSAVTVPEDGGKSLIPLMIEFDLFKIFENGNYKNFANLAANLAGFDLDKVDLHVIAEPKVSTNLGDLSPGQITIVKQKI